MASQTNKPESGNSAEANLAGVEENEVVAELESSQKQPQEAPVESPALSRSGSSTAQTPSASAAASPQLLGSPTFTDEPIARRKSRSGRPISANAGLTSPVLRQTSNSSSSGLERRQSRRYSRILPIDTSADVGPAPSLPSPTKESPPEDTSSKSESRSNSIFGSLLRPERPGSSPIKRFQWFKHNNLSGSVVSPMQSTDSLVSGSRGDFVLRRINATNEQRQGEEAKEDFKSGIRELQQNFAEMTRESERYASIDWEFWTQVVQDYELVARTQSAHLRKAIQNGFPAELRGILWQLIASSKSAALEHLYSSLATETSPHENAIEKDLDRTSMAKQVDRESLSRLLKTYSLFDPEVGYTQGMAFLAVPLLFDLSEYEAFCLFVQLMKGYDFRSLFLPEMPGLHLKLYQFERLIEDRLETVHTHLKRQGVLPSMYASQWFLTLFAYKFPLSLVERVFDIVVAEGYEAVLRFGFALIVKSADRILQLEFDDLLPFLKDSIFDCYVETPNDLVRDASLVELTPSVLAKYELEHQELNRFERERNEQMDALRSSNSRFTLQVRQLEISLAELNLEHVEIANKMVESGLENARLAFENEELQREVDFLRQAVANETDKVDLLKQVEELTEIRGRLESQIGGLQDALAELATASPRLK